MLKLILMMNLFLHAEVNVKDASFLKFWTEANFHRTYKSRSIHKGWLGTGWCTEFEKSLLIRGNEIILSDCMIDRDSQFTLKNKVFISNTDPRDRILISDTYYTREIGDDTIQKFDRAGRLVYLKSPSKKMEVTFGTNGKYKQVTLDETYKLSFTWNSKVGTSVRLQGPRMVQFLYLIDKNLKEVRKGSQSLYKYSYDDYDNLTSILSGNESEYMKYTDTDQIKEYIVKGCTNRYKYSSISNLHSLTIRKITCVKSSTEIRYHFFYENRERNIILTRVRAEFSNNKSIEQTFDSVTGLPLTAIKQEAP